MTAEQFKAAGLDKLSPEELANLNTWLDRTITTETAKAAEQASVQTKERVESENRGFFHFGSDDPIESRLTGTFAGFRTRNTYTLANGHQWPPTHPASPHGVPVAHPAATIAPITLATTRTTPPNSP